MTVEEAYAAYNAAFPEGYMTWLELGFRDGLVTLDGEFTSAQLRKLAELLDALGDGATK